MRLVNFSRFVYCILLRLHPNSFRVRFADEMLWIFDEEASISSGATLHLFLDALRSVVLQHANVESYIEPTSTGLYVEIETSRLSPPRFVQAGMIASVVLTGFAFLLGQWKPIPSVSGPYFSVSRRESQDAHIRKKYAQLFTQNGGHYVVGSPKTN